MDGNAEMGAKRKRLPGTPGRKQHHQQEDIPWTAARCNRLLRTITSRIHILRRLSENNFADKAVAKQSPARRKIAFRPEDNDTKNPISYGIEDATSRLATLTTIESPTKDSNDPEWLPDGHRLAQRTYAGKGHKARKVSPEETPKPTRSSSNADLRSPFIKRMLRADAANSPTHQITDTPRRLTSQKIVLDPKTHAERALRTLLDSFDKVLSITTTVYSGQRRGVGSLRDMCLRQVPSFINMEQKFAYDEQEYDFDATETVYLQLEALGNGSWTGLREIVRAHAVNMIAGAMDERSWPVQSLDRLMTVCENNHAVREGQQILRSWFVKANGDEGHRMIKLLAWSKILDCAGFFFRLICETLEDDFRRVAEVAQCPLWEDLLKAMARKSSRTEAVRFLGVYVVACSRCGNETASASDKTRLHEVLKRNETFHNIMAMATAVCSRIDSYRSPSLVAPDSLTSHICRAAVAAWHNSSGQLEQVLLHPQQSWTHLRTLESMLTSSILIHSLSPENGSHQPLSLNVEATYQHLLIHGAKRDYQACQMMRADLVQATATCLSHFSPLSADDFVRNVCSSLLLLSTHTPKPSQAVLTRFAIDTAALWARNRGDNNSYIFADEIKQATSRGRSLLQHASRNSSTNPSEVYALDNTIDELVSSTPLKAQEPGCDVHQQLSKQGRAKSYELGTRECMVMLEEPADSIPNTNKMSVYNSSHICANAMAITHEHADSPSLCSSLPAAIQADQDSANDRFPSENVLALATDSVTETLEVRKIVAESLLGVKTLRHLPDHPRCDNVDRDELSATPFNRKPDKQDASRERTVQIKSTPETPRQGSLVEPSYSTLTLRPKTSATASVGPVTPISQGRVDAREGAQALKHVERTEDCSPVIRMTSRSGKYGARSKACVKYTVPSTRVLRSAIKRAEPPVQDDICIEPRDELAMTPAQPTPSHPRRSKKGKPAEQAVQVLDEGEHDELRATPKVRDYTRAGFKVSTRGRKARCNVQGAGLNQRGSSNGAQRQTEMPLQARSANIKTSTRQTKSHVSDDELGI